MTPKGWKERLEDWRGGGPIERGLAPYQDLLHQIDRAGQPLRRADDGDLKARAAVLRVRGQRSEPVDSLLIEVFALVRETAERVVGMRPYDEQVMAGAALHRGKLVEMPTGEGKTLAAVLPAALNALSGRGAHILTFNDYLARRDARWMGPIYEFLGLSVGAVQEGQPHRTRRAAYAADVTYATAKEAGFDFLRAQLCFEPDEIAQRPFHYAIIDEADSILIDEARVPLVIAGERPTSATDPYRLAEVVSALEEGAHWNTDEHARNVHFTDRGYDSVERALGCGNLHTASNYLLLTEVNQALHARVLISRDVDYIVRDQGIELVDEFTGRVAPDRRWPDGLQAALEAKEGLPVRPGGWILGSIPLQYFIRHYPRVAGMTATAQPAAAELEDLYGLKVVPIPSHRPCVRQDLPDLVFTHAEAKHQALLTEIAREHARGRPVLVGTASVDESELLGGRLEEAGIPCEVLNARNDEAEARIIARAGTPGAVTISTNMAGRGTDIRLGGPDEEERDRVVAMGGLCVIGTNRHESRRIDDQLRGRAGRQGDPGCSRFWVSLEDHLMTRFGLDALIPKSAWPARRSEPVDNPVIRREVARLQRIVEGQNFEVRKTLWRYSSPVESQRREVQTWRRRVLREEVEPEIGVRLLPDVYPSLVKRLGRDAVRRAERRILLHHLDAAWAEHLSFVAHVREGIHLAGIGGQNPLLEFTKQIGPHLGTLMETVEDRVAATLREVAAKGGDLDLEGAGVKRPSSTWTYLIHDRALSELQQILLSPGTSTYGAGGLLMTWPLLLGWAAWKRVTKGGARRGDREEG